MLSDGLTERLRLRFGPDVQPWLDGVAALVERLAVRWGLTVLATMSAGSTSCTFRCRRADGSLAYLKLTPDAEVFGTEAAALRAWASCPAVVSLLDVADEDNALLIEALEPGTPLSDWRPAGALLRQLREVPAPIGFPTVADRVDFMFTLAHRRNPGVPAALLDASYAAARRLADTGSVARLVHGDLHPGNVLASARGPVAIDPRPCLGDPDLDVVDWTLFDVTTVDEVRTRIAALDVLDEDRAYEWSRALAVLLLMSHVRRGIDDPGTALFRQLAESLT
ncbi:aminoglycoside phosphotransferase family protein [Kutzneria chonburiensis]|uniref:Aminoglycoside phosphotransferase family protein n=1 Tax=Kutzneria chonburiensis TaxID=1483604 RepID=A0ABV6N050_9PSEU|nr:aminoglycoside phosphotransferase family protein [Kutzneria chonburiensis]